jgi:polyhydroxybutyrate depolymerase
VKRKTEQRFNGMRRSYRLHIPSGYQPQQAAPMVIVVHGAFSTAKQIEKQTGFSTLADRFGFVAAYPNGIGIFGFLQHWNAGHCCGKAAADGIDDIGFIDETIADARRILNIDPSRIYMVGFSNGGMFTHRYGAERGATLAAIASLAGPAGGRADPQQPEWRIPPPQAPLPVIAFHGTGDDKVPYAGGPGGGKPDGRHYLSARESASIWVAHNRCDPQPVVQKLRGGSVEITRWADCRGGVVVALYTLRDWGHQWPGPFFTGRLDPQAPLHGFDAAAIIWEFFQKHQR